MPDVPNAPGVPALTSFSPTGLALLAADVLSFLGVAPVWGIFQGGVPVIASDNTLSLEFKQDFPISDYPVEPNSFQSYNKVQLPADVRVSVSRGGSVADRAELINSVGAVMNTTDLYDVVTPEIVYTGYNFSHQDMRRAARNGVGLVTIDLWMTQIRESGKSTFTNTQQPGDAGQVASGNVQPVTAPASVQGIVGQGIG